MARHSTGPLPACWRSIASPSAVITLLTGKYYSPIALYDYNFNQVTPGWSFTNWSSGTPQCNYSGAFNSYTDVTLYYGPPTFVLTDNGNGVACPSIKLSWNSMAGATSYQLWSREGYPTLAPSYSQGWTGTATSLRVSLPINTAFFYEVAACNASGCFAFSTPDYVEVGECLSPINP